MEYARDLQTKTNVCELLAATAEGNFFFDIRDEVVGWCLAHGNWEPTETLWIKSIVRPGDVVLDVGANLGWYTVVAGRQVGDHGRIVSFEPDSRNFSLLKRNVEANNLSQRCLLHNFALLDSEQVCTIERSTSNFGDHRVRFDGAKRGGDSAFEEDARETTGAFAITLDAAIERDQLKNRPIRLLKVDAQGSEVRIFKGAQRTLRDVEYVLCEYWPYAINRAGGSASQFVECLSSYFSEFCRFTVEPMMFRPIADLADDLADFARQYSKPGDQEMYVFRKHPHKPGVCDDEQGQRQLSQLHSERPKILSSLPGEERVHKAPRTKGQDEDLFRFDGWFASKFPSSITAGRTPTLRAALSIFVRRRGTLILETGCQRQFPDNGDGGSTVIFASIIEALRKDRLVTVDSSIESLNLAKELVYREGCADRVEFHLGDSVEFLRDFKEPIDLLYLDSWDYVDEEPFRCQSQNHQLQEIAAAYDKLTNGAVVLLDQNDFPSGGKTKLAKQFLRDRDWFCVLDMQQSLWIRSIDP